MKHIATVWHRCQNPNCDWAGRKIAIEIELLNPLTLVGVKVTCPVCGRENVWYKRAPAPAVGARG